MDSHIRSIKVWWEMGYGSGLAREVENLVWCEALSGPGDSMLGGRRLGLVQGILETSPGHSVKSGNTWFQCVSHLLHSRARQCPHNFAFVTLELLKVSEETETKKTKKKFWYVCLRWKSQDFTICYSPFTQATLLWVCVGAEFLQSSRDDVGRDPAGFENINYLTETWRHQQPQKLFLRGSNLTEGVTGEGLQNEYSEWAQADLNLV